MSNYRHIINHRLKHIYFVFDDKGTLVIKSPKISQKKIEALLLSKTSWIQASLKKFQNKKGKTLDFTNILELYYLGVCYPLKLIQYDKKRVKLEFDTQGFTLFYHYYDEELFQKYINLFYKKEAERYIPEKVAIFAKKMKLFPQKISFRKTKRQWGSCSGQNNLSFNSMMMKLPKNVIEYIIVHELAHIKYKHHQKTFWKCVEDTLPGYKIQVKELKNYTT